MSIKRNRRGSFTGGILSRDQHLDYQAIFSSYDDDHDGKISSVQAVQAMRALGHILTKEIGQDIECDIDIEMDCECNYNQFVGLLEKYGPKCLKPKRRDLLNAFKAFDSKNRGVIHAGRFKSVLQKLGDPLDDEEAADFIQQCNKDGKKEFVYGDMVRAMQGPTTRRLSLFGSDARNQSKAYKSTEA